VKSCDAAVELDIIDMGALEQDDDEESPVRVQIEARFIACRVEELISSGYMIPDGLGGMRPVGYSDIVILLRSIRGKAWQYAAALAERGIPADLPGQEGFFETVEISGALSLLSVIDNPLQDIPLAAVLRGPVFGFTDDELASIRAKSRGTDFYMALVKAAETDDKCADFLLAIDALRAVMPDMPADRFIWHVYNKTGLLGRVGAMRGGDRRRNNLILLAEYARSFEQSGYKGLFGFLTYIRGLQERGAEIARGASEPASSTDAPDAVRIMSIHKSKGLEFPIVILADTSKRINNQDAQQRLVLHPMLGAGSMRTDRQRRIEYTTLARTAIQSKLTSEMMAEELRVLYVAMTRAREKLIITAAYKDAEREVEKISKLSTARIAPQVLEEIKNMAGWIILPLFAGGNLKSASHSVQAEAGDDEETAVSVTRLLPFTGGEPQFVVHSVQVEGGEAVVSEQGGGASTWEIAIAAATAEAAAQRYFEGQSEERQIRSKENTETKETPVNKENTENKESAKRADVELLRERFSFVYPHEMAPNLPSKLTVTGLTGRHFDQEADILHQASFENRQNDGFYRPSFIAKKTGMTAAERGTALHLAMQYLDMTKCQSADGIKEELLRLAGLRLLTEEQAAAVDVQKVLGFFRSDIGKRVLIAEDVKREFKFSLLCPAGQLYPGGGDDEILLQGVIDCFFEEEGTLTVIDFKTDYVTHDTFEEKARSYTPQLAAYSNALERITGTHVKERIIYFFALDRCVQIS